VPKNNLGTFNLYRWWQTGIIYEIYLRSFQDSNNDGIGDLKGVVSRLDYLQWLGINIIWITPFYPSPMKDFGYDVSDYTAVDPLFGTMNDFDELLEEVHKRNMKLVIDFVPNHTSDQHPWFQQSRFSKNNSKRDWYIWKDKNAQDSYPNNWLSVLGGPAWEWDEHTGQYYYHAFLKEQPDLNLENIELRAALANVMRFWLQKGVDGFRIDVMWHLMKDELFRNNPPNPKYHPSMPECDKFLQIYNCDRPRVHEIIAEFRKVVDEYDDRLLMGEIYLPMNKFVQYYGSLNNGAHLPSNFELLFIPWKAEDIGRAIREYESILPDGAWPNWVLGNHDRPRLRGRIDKKQLGNAAILLLTLRGTPIMYYGDEIGIPQVHIEDADAQDPQGKSMPGKNLNRDAERTPMQWDQTLNAGFTGGKSWLPLSDHYEVQNVLVEKNDDQSLLWLYKKLITLRQNTASLMWGTYKLIFANKQIIAYQRKSPNDFTFFVVLNLSDDKAQFHLENFSFTGEIVIHTNEKLEGIAVKDMFALKANQGCVIRVDN